MAHAPLRASRARQLDPGRRAWPPTNEAPGPASTILTLPKAVSRQPSTQLAMGVATRVALSALAVLLLQLGAASGARSPTVPRLQRGRLRAAPG